MEGSDMGGRIRPGMDLTWVTWVQTVQWRIAATHPFTVGDKDKQAKSKTDISTPPELFIG